MTGAQGQKLADREEMLGEALFVLSARLKDSGFFDSDENHIAYERVVAAFNTPRPDPAGLEEVARTFERLRDSQGIPEDGRIEVDFRALFDVLTLNPRDLIPSVDAERGWQPIETAPKGETRMLLCRPGSKPWIGFWSNWNCWWTDGSVDSSRDHAPCTLPTHWQPMPDPAAIRAGSVE